jgi:antitoxin ParD1/3/4
MGTNVSLTPELENFAKYCVESGRYNNVSEVMRNALRLLKEKEERRVKFNAMLDAVREETERDGGHTIDDVLLEVDEIIEQASQQ